MNEERWQQSGAAPGAAAPPELQEILEDLRSPDATTRACAVRALCPCRGVEWGVPVFRHVWEMRKDADPGVRRAVKHDLAENPWWSARQEARPREGPKPRAAKVTLAVKGMALADLCARLQAETGVVLAVDSRVSDDKVTLFCDRMPLRDVMQQLGSALGYVWVRSVRDGAYSYDLVRDPRAPRPQELRERERWRTIVGLEPEGAAEQARLAAIYRATGMPIVADVPLPRDPLRGYPAPTRGGSRPCRLASQPSRRFPQDKVTVRDVALFDALNRLAEIMELRWQKDGDWLEFR